MATEQDSDALAEDLHEAVCNNDVTQVRSLLGQGADPNHQLYWSDDEWAFKLPPLHYACYEGYLEIVKTLVTHGARTDKGDGSDNSTPLHWACREGHKEIVQYLIQEVRCSTDVRNNDNETSLHSACAGGSKDLVQYLVEEVKMDVGTPLTEENSDALEKMLLDNKIKGFALTGERTYKAVERHLQELGHRELAANLRANLDKALNEFKSEQALNEAMKAGFVRVNTTNILFFGMAGTGKTSTKHLLLGLPPPVDRNSTPLASTAERICIRQIRDTTKIRMETQEDSSRTWKPVSSDDLQRIVADAIKSHVTSSDSEEYANPQELSIALKQLEPSNESSTPVDATPSTSRATKPSVAGAKITRSKQERKKIKFLSTVSNVMANIQRFSDADRTAVQEKFGFHWIYIIDSGGQPHFHNLLPLFMPKISVALYTLRLSDCLDDHPLVEYYKDNKPVGECFKSHLSVLDNFKYLVQSIQSHSENCKLVCIGTHKDHQSECKETLSDKNKTLLNFAEKDCIKKLTMFFNLGITKEILFPVDCKHCDSDSQEVAKTIREYVHKLSQELNNIEIKVPFWWFLLQIIVEKVSNDENRKVLSKDECVEIAKALHNFHEDALCEALKFFHEHNIFHYYPAILPNVVFCDTQVLLDKVTELVEYAAYVRASNGFGTWLDFTDKGIITIQLLSDKNFEKHYVDEIFAPTHLIEIFKHLLIATPFHLFSQEVGKDKRFYMPSLLSLLPPTQVNDKRADLLKTGLIPLVLHFKSNWQCCGVFCCLQVYLIKECEWEIEMEDHQPSRNFVQFVHREEDCFITLIDGFSFLEIHSSNNQKEMLSLISENIYSGLRSAYKALKYTYEDPEVTFLCPFISQSISSPSPQVPHHPAHVLVEDDVMRCTLCKTTYELKDGHKDWLSPCCKLEVDIQNQTYLKKLDELMADESGTIELHYLKTHFIGPSDLGKTTTRQRLVGSITNLSLLPEDQRKRCSTLLAECEQVLAFMDKSGTKLEFKASSNLEEETQFIFSYLMSCEPIEDSTVSNTSPPKEQPTQETTDPKIEDSTVSNISLPKEQPTKKTTDPKKQTQLKIGESATVPQEAVSPIPEPPEKVVKVTTVDVEKVISRLRNIVGSGEYTKELLNKVLLNLVDIGGQPGFVEMFPFLSKGAGIFLVFFRLDKDLDDMCQVSYERGKDKITPYDSTYTSRETLSQILSAISHHIKIDSDIDRELCSKLGNLGSAKPVATLIGTFKDKLAMQIKVNLLYEKYCDLTKTACKSDSTTASKSDSTTANKSDSTTASKSLNVKKAIQNILTHQKNDEHANVSAEDMAAIEQTVSHHLNSDAFKKDVQDRLEQKLTEKNEGVTKITSKFENLLSNPKDTKFQFIAVDNYEGTDSDMEPLREHLHGLFSSYFKHAKLRIRPQQLLFGVVLRKEFDIVSMEECIRIGTEGLKMREEEVRFTVWYLDRYVGALIYHPEIKDKDGWFGNFIICNPQVVFNSLSVLVVKPLLELHSEDSSIHFKDAERNNWILKGQFSMETITRCHSKENQGVKKDQLIPVEKLLILLKHSHLLAKITTVKEDHTTEEIETRYFIPAILKCASREELTKPPPTGIDTPSPIKITFKPQYVPTGLFCAMISDLVSRGSKGKGILGMTWKLATDTSVKRNLVSFHIDESANHFVTLIAHVDCYEIRIIRQNRKYTMHELCSYILSTLLLVMKDISPLLSPILAFDCYCGKHEDAMKLCLLTPGVYPCFNCNSEISLSPHQECWFAKEVSLGDDVTLLAFPYAEDLDPSLSFKWKKTSSKIKGSENELEFKASLNDHFEGFISCEISKNQKDFFTVYHCLRNSIGIAVHDDQEDEDQLYTKDLQEVLSQLMEAINVWFELGLALGIPVATLGDIKCHTHCNKDGLIRMLAHWLESSPSRTWSDICNGLKSCTVKHDVLANTIEKKYNGRLSGKRKRPKNCSCVPGPHAEDSSRPPHITDPLAPGHRKRLLGSGEEVETLSKRPKNDITIQGSSQEEHTNRNQTVQRSSIVLTGDDVLTICESLNNASNDWFNLGLALGMKFAGLKNIQDRYSDNNRRLTEVVGKRLQVTDPPMTWPYICECLRRPTIERNDVAEEIEDKYVTAFAHSATN